MPDRHEKQRSDEPREAQSGGADALVSVRQQLLPLTDALVDQLVLEGDEDSANWFRRVRASLESARGEEDLIILFMEQLGPTAPLADAAGFSLTARMRLDALLACAQDVAFAFSADGDLQ